MKAIQRWPALFSALLLALVSVSTPSVADTDVADVHRGINAKYLSPELDVERWTENFESESREIFRSRRAIVDALGITPGMSVADVGAGTGLFLTPLSKAVGPTGRLYANEISPVFAEHLRSRAAQEGLPQVEVMLGGERATGLAEATVDLVFLCDVYHHFEYPDEMLADIRGALRPGGRLVVVDFERTPGKTRDWILDHVRAGKQAIRKEIAAAGFVLEAEAEVNGLEENYLLRFRRP